MVFGIGYGELAVIVAMSAVVLGPKDLPIVARALGRFSGQAVGFLYKARRQFDAYADRSELSKLHEELQHGLHEISAIRNEIRSGVAVFRHDPSLGTAAHAHAYAPRPPPVTDSATHQAAMTNPAGSGSGALPFTPGGSDAMAASPSGSTGSATTLPGQGATWPGTRLGEGDPLFSPSSTLPGHGSDRGSPPPLSRGGWERIDTGLPPVASAAVDNARMVQGTASGQVSPPGGAAVLYGSSEGPGGHIDESGAWEPLPVSAVVAGLLPVRRGKDVTATDIFADALEEREIARKSLTLVQQHARSRGPDA
eukprot:jgi/Mesvir1/28876/Mv17971-RA.1